MSRRRLSRNAVFREIALDILSDGSGMYLRDICPVFVRQVAAMPWLLVGCRVQASTCIDQTLTVGR